MSTDRPEYDFDTSRSEPGGEFDPSQYDGAGSEDIEETGVEHEPEDLTEEELAEADSTLVEDDESDDLEDEDDDA